MCVRVRTCAGARALVCVRARGCVCVSVCVCERERGRERDGYERIFLLCKNTAIT